jgi:hypothetical protein
MPEKLIRFKRRVLNNAMRAAFPAGIVMFATGLVLAGLPVKIKEAVGIGDIIFTILGILLFASGSVLMWFGSRDRGRFVGNIHMEMDEVRRMMKRKASDEN